MKDIDSFTPNVYRPGGTYIVFGIWSRNTSSES